MIKYIELEKDLNVDNKKEQFLFDEYDAPAPETRTDAQSDRVSEKARYEKTF